ncbi:MAG: type II toxin-antitoxin system PemK/MazF family toxin [Candidatus Desantisbacteria bacterium]
MYKQREILLIPIPYTDLSSQKKRPVVVVSNNHYNSLMEDIVVVAITSNVERRDYSIMISHKDMEEGTLLYESMIRIDKIYTLKQSIIVKRFGLIKKE